MNLSLVNLSKLKSHAVILALTIEDLERGDVYVRKYYRVVYKDHSEFVFLTTNEPDSRFEIRCLDEDFTLVKNFDEMMNDFEKTELIGLAIDAGFNSPPKYIYYDIITIDNNLKPKMLEHLKNSISGYTELDFTKHEQNQLIKWMSVLKT